MITDKNETQRGVRWFAIAGSVAVLFAFGLYTVDETLSNSPRERKLGQTLLELRSAQTTLPASQSPDDRLGH